MKKRKFGITWFVLFFIMACSGSQKLSVGKYSNRKNCSIFSFSSDSTFEYKRTIVPGSGFVEKYSSGKWTYLGNNTLILNSHKQERVALIKAEIISANNKNSTVVVKLDVEGQEPADYISRPIFPQSTSDKYKYGGIGCYSFNISTKIDSIYFEIEKRPQKMKILGANQPDYYVVKTKTIPLDYIVGDSVILYLSISDSLFSYRIFNDEVLKMKGNKILFFDTENKERNKLALSIQQK